MLREQVGGTGTGIVSLYPPPRKLWRTGFSFHGRNCEAPPQTSNVVGVKIFKEKIRVGGRGTAAEAGHYGSIVVAQPPERVKMLVGV
jgi:hypothetical protein